MTRGKAVCIRTQAGIFPSIIIIIGPIMLLYVQEREFNSGTWPCELWVSCRGRQRRWRPPLMQKVTRTVESGTSKGQSEGAGATKET